jgi:hypothetical protein
LVTQLADLKKTFDMRDSTSAPSLQRVTPVYIQDPLIFGLALTLAMAVILGSSGRDECGINLLLSFGTGNEIVKVKNVAGRVIVLILEGRATHI